MGLARIKGRGAQAERHLSLVTGMEGELLTQHIEDAWRVWKERNEHDWELDISMLTGGGFRIIRSVKTEDRRAIAATVRSHL